MLIIFNITKLSRQPSVQLETDRPGVEASADTARAAFT